jgi:4'-phosphopantetheinyl transferase
MTIARCWTPGVSAVPGVQYCDPVQVEDGTRVAIAERKIHAWRVPLEPADADIAYWASLLDGEERARADAFVFAPDRHRFIVSHANLRLILARYLDAAPASIRFEHGPNGKPALAAPLRHSGIEFNLSHSKAHALVAVARGFPIGVDTEHIRPELATADMIASVFSPAEQAAIAAVAEFRRAEAFFKCWTSKEAYLKGTGSGLSLSAQEFDVSVEPDARVELLRPHPALDSDAPWSLHGLPGERGYVAVIAAAAVPRRIGAYVATHAFKSARRNQG